MARWHLCRCELQGNPVAGTAGASASRFRSRSMHCPVTLSRARSKVSRRLPAPCFRCCRPTMRPETSPRSVQRLPVRVHVPAEIAREQLLAARNVGRRQREYQIDGAVCRAAAAAKHGNPLIAAEQRQAGTSHGSGNNNRACHCDSTPDAERIDPGARRRLPRPCASACSWRSSTFRWCRPRSRKSRLGLPHRATKSPGCRLPT